MKSNNGDGGTRLGGRVNGRVCDNGGTQPCYRVTDRVMVMEVLDNGVEWCDRVMVRWWRV